MKSTSIGAVLILFFSVLFISHYSYAADFDPGADNKSAGVPYTAGSVIVIAKSEQERAKQDAEKHKTTYLFVINFDTGSYAEGKLTLNGNGQSNVIYFRDVQSGHIGVVQFAKLWERGINGFTSAAPNATLSLIAHEQENNSVITISHPKVDGNSISFNAKLVSGEPPVEFKTGGLFLGQFSDELIAE